MNNKKRYNTLAGEKTQINFRADPETIKIIEAIAFDLGISKSKAIVMAIRQSEEAKKRDDEELIAQIEKLKWCLNSTIEAMEKVIKNG